MRDKEIYNYLKSKGAKGITNVYLSFLSCIYHTPSNTYNIIVQFLCDILAEAYNNPHNIQNIIKLNLYLVIQNIINIITIFLMIFGIPLKKISFKEYQEGFKLCFSEIFNFTKEIIGINYRFFIGDPLRKIYDFFKS